MVSSRCAAAPPTRSTSACRERSPAVCSVPPSLAVGSSGSTSERARLLPGVWAIITAADAPAHRSGLAIKDQPLFAVERVTHEGEPIAAVAAESAAAADEAIQAIELEIDGEDPVVDLDLAVSEEAPLVHPDWERFEPVHAEFPRGGNICAEMRSDPPGVDEGFAAGAPGRRG